MFLPIRFRTNIQLPIADLRGDFGEILVQKLHNELAGKCSRFGFIKPNSIQIEKRSCGKFIKQHFNGYITYELICRSEVCNPPKDSKVEAVVKNKNALGILAESSITIDGKDITILDIIIPRRAAGITSEIDLDTLNIGDKFHIMVMGKCYQLNDSKISIIGRAIHPTKMRGVKEGELIDEVAEADAPEDEVAGEEDVDDDDGSSSDDSSAKSEAESEEEVKDIIVGGLDDDILGGMGNDDLYGALDTDADADVADEEEAGSDEAEEFYEDD